MSVGMLCLAFFDEDDLFYRARVLAINEGKNPRVEAKVEVS